MLIVCPSCASAYTIEPEKLGAHGRRVRCAACRQDWFVEPPREDGAEFATSDAGVVDATGFDTGGWSDDGPGCGSEETTPAFAASAEAPPNDDADPDEADRDEAVAFPHAHGETIAASAASHRAGRLRGFGKAGVTRLKPGLLARFAMGPHLSGAALLCIVALPVAALAFARDSVVRHAPRFATLYAALGHPVNLRGLEFREIHADWRKEGDGTLLVVEGALRNITTQPQPVPRIAVELQGSRGELVYTWTADAPQPMLKPGETVPFRTRLASPPPEAERALVRFAQNAPGLADAGRTR
jgi:predicted Zn finger-like uncharacterized protein